MTNTVEVTTTGIDKCFQLLSGCLATGLKFEICKITIFSHVESPLMIEYKEKLHFKTLIRGPLSPFRIVRVTIFNLEVSIE